MMQPLQITPPYGYDEIVPMQTSHRVLLRPGVTPGFSHAINALAVSYTEFVAASRDYPIVFTSGDNGSTFLPVVVLGLALRQNLFMKALVTRGLMGRIFAHFHSLENFARLYQRAVARQTVA
jgi:hypothetical protein